MRSLMLRKLMILVILTGWIIPSITVAAVAPVQVKVDGKEVVFPDAKPYVEADRVLIPMRFVLEALSVTVSYKDRLVAVKQGDKTITLKVDSKNVNVNGKTVVLDVPARIKQSRTYVPLRFVSEALGATVHYADRVVTITTGTSGGVERETPTGSYKPYEPDTKHHELAPFLFQNNMRVEGQELVVTMPDLKRSSGRYTPFGKDDVMFQAGKEYRFKLGENGYLVFSLAHADERIEAYIIYLNPKHRALEGQFDQVKGEVIVVNSHPTSASTASTLSDVLKLYEGGHK